MFKCLIGMALQIAYAGVSISAVPNAIIFEASVRITCENSKL